MKKITKFLGEIEVGKSYFEAKRAKVKIGRREGKKTPVFSMLKRDVKIYTQVVKNCKAS